MRKDLYKLRESWKRIYPQDFLDNLDVRIHHIDPKWPLWTSNAEALYATRFNKPSQNSLPLNGAALPDSSKMSNGIEPFNRLNNSPSPQKRSTSRSEGSNSNVYSKIPKTMPNPMADFKAFDVDSTLTQIKPVAQNQVEPEVDEQTEKRLFSENFPHLNSVLERFNLINKKYDIFIGRKMFVYTLGGHQVEIIVNNTKFQFYIESSTMNLIINNQIAYKMWGEVSNFEGQNVFFRSQELTVYIDNSPITMHYDAPPLLINFGEVSFYAQIRNFKFYADNKFVAKCHQKNETNFFVANQKHVLRFSQKPEKIAIDQKMCKVYFDGFIPLLFNGSEYQIVT